MKNKELIKSRWMYRYKRKVILVILSVMTVSIILTMAFMAQTLRTSLLEDSKHKTWELSEAIGSSLRHLMSVRNSEKIQETLESIQTSKSSVVKAFIIDNVGRVVYSSNQSEIGLIIDRLEEDSCRICHISAGAIPSQTTMILHEGGQDVLRNVNIIHNETACHACHSPTDRINGKLIIDRSINPTYSLIANMEFILLLSGGLCLLVLVPLLSNLISRGVNTYIKEVDVRSAELAMMYMIVERLSKTIDIEELKHIVVEMIAELFDPDEIHIILPREGSEYTGVIWRRNDRKMERRMPPGQDPYLEEITAWLHGDLPEIEFSRDKKTAAIPVTKGNNRMALIIIRKDDGDDNSFGLNILKGMGSHLSVAFENAALYRIAITDELTGLYSRRHFRHIIRKKFDLFEQYGEKVTFLMIDIDDFKKINDTFGHPEGDRILKEVAQCILHSTREQDFAFRHGGEEFSVILPATDSASGHVVAERIRELIENSVFSIQGASINMTVSIGEASCPENARCIRDLITEADKALYEAKRTGKNRVVVSGTEGLSDDGPYNGAQY